MSYNVLVIPEDATHDHYILKPILSALLQAAGKPQARVRVLLDPAVQGVDQALDDAFIAEVITRYPMVDLFLLCVDRDGRPGREHSLEERERRASDALESPRCLMGTAAHQEAEVWCLAGMRDLPREWSWQEIRSEPHAKEVYYEPYARRRNLLDAPGDGREILGREASSRYRSIRRRCSEVMSLERRISSVAIV